MRLLFVLLLILPLSACLFDRAPEVVVLTGETMGTTYSVAVVDPPKGVNAKVLGSKIDTVLADVNAKMSNWDPASEVSLFNAAESTDPVAISPDFATVMTAANRVHALSEEKFDVTLAPLIELWGFGPKRPGEPIPDDAAISAALEAVGQSTKLTLGEGTLAKSRPDVSVNLSAIAKGYGVDRIADVIEDEGVDRYVVEIGGDLYARGLNGEDAPWTIGIEQPDATTRAVDSIIALEDKGLATSGDYRNFFEEDGVRYSHIIDPTTGRPIVHGTASVTVVAESAMMADALATAFLVLGSEAGLPIAREAGMSVMFIDRSGDGFVSVATEGFDTLVLSGGS